MNTKLDVVIALLLILGLCGGLFGLAGMILDAPKLWRQFWHRWNWHRNSTRYMARWRQS